MISYQKVKHFNRFSGIILVSTLLFLLALTLLTMSILQTSLLEIKMSVNYKDNILTLHKAEIELRDKEMLLETGVMPLPSQITLISNDVCGVNFYRISVNYGNEILQSTYAIIDDAIDCAPKPDIKQGRQSWVILPETNPG